MLVLLEDPSKAQKAVLSIAGAKVRRFSVTAKFRHVIRSDFQQTYDLKVSLKNKLYVYAVHLYVLWHRKLCFAI